VRLPWLAVALTATMLGACGGSSGSNGSDERIVAFEGAADENSALTPVVQATMSPDGTEIVYVDAAGALRVAPVESASDGVLEGVEVPVAGGWFPRVLADGTIATRADNRASTVVIVERDGSTVDTIEIPREPTQVMVDPSGAYVYYAVDASDGAGIFRMPSGGGDEEVIVEWGGRRSFGGFTLDRIGARIAYSIGAEGTEFSEEQELTVANADGSEPVLVDDRALGMAAFSPDGRSVAFIRAGDVVDGFPTTRVATAEIDNGEPVLLTAPDELVRVDVIGWSSDGAVFSRIASYGYENKLGRIDVDQG
jgi:DNA-binding beta-propeller fold protein YncE